MSMRGSLYDKDGRRRYLTPNERRRFLSAAKARSRSERLFCETLAGSGVRVSEALSISDQSLDFELLALVIESLKKREQGIYRAIPVPRELLDELKALAPDLSSVGSPHGRLWPWCRTTAYYLVKDVMRDAEIAGPQASPKGLRHGFAINALAGGVPLNMIQKWMGHSNIEITSIYLDATGEEERCLASKMWASSTRKDDAAQTCGLPRG